MDPKVFFAKTFYIYKHVHNDVFWSNEYTCSSTD